MKAGYRFLEHTADELFVAEAPKRESLFEQCGLAVEEIMVNVKKVSPTIEQEINEEANKIENLLFDFLSDLVFYKDAEQLVFSKFKITIKEEKGKYLLHCRAYGEKINYQKHEPKVDIKAITLHMFEVKKISGGWQARVLVDI